jgi:outer membrane protein assembly factor BamB
MEWFVPILDLLTLIIVKKKHVELVWKFEYRTFVFNYSWLFLPVLPIQVLGTLFISMSQWYGRKFNSSILGIDMRFGESTII